jgi:hypothetical protein
MLNAPAYSEIIRPGERSIEHDSTVCKHCGRIMLMKPGFGSKPFMVVMRADGTHYEREAGFCRNCYGHICPVCDGKGCKPYLAKIDEDEAAQRKRLICEGL